MKLQYLSEEKKLTEQNNFVKFATYNDLEKAAYEKIIDTALSFPRGLIGLTISDNFESIYNILWKKAEKKIFQKISITISTENADGNEFNFKKYLPLLTNDLGINKKRINTPLRIGKKLLNDEEVNKFSKLIMKSNYHDLLFVSFDGKNGAVEAVQPNVDSGEIHLLSSIKNVNGNNIASIGLAEILNAKEIILIVKTIEDLNSVVKLFSMTKYDPNFPLSSLLNAVGKINFYSNFDFPTNNLAINFPISNQTEELKNLQNPLESIIKQDGKEINLKKIQELDFSRNSKKDIENSDLDDNFYEDENFRFHVVNERAELIRRHKILRQKILVITEKTNILKVARMEYIKRVDSDNFIKATIQVIDHKGNIKRYEEENLITRNDIKVNSKKIQKNKTSLKKNIRLISFSTLMSPIKPGTPPSIRNI